MFTTLIQLKKKVLFKWLPLAVVTTLLSGLIYGTVQQSLRQSANDPQIQIAEDVSSVLSKGVSVQSIISSNGNVDMAQSLVSFVIVYDASGKVLASTAQLDGEIPTPPSGVFDYTKAHGEDRFTWQPRAGAGTAVRDAVVVTSFKSPAQSGFVLAGRSLREVEKRENRLSLQVFIGWLITLIMSFGSYIFRDVFKPRADNKTF